MQRDVACSVHPVQPITCALMSLLSSFPRLSSPLFASRLSSPLSSLLLSRLFFSSYPRRRTLGTRRAIATLTVLKSVNAPDTAPDTAPGTAPDTVPGAVPDTFTCPSTTVATDVRHTTASNRFSCRASQYLLHPPAAARRRAISRR